MSFNRVKPVNQFGDNKIMNKYIKHNNKMAPKQSEAVNANKSKVEKPKDSTSTIEDKPTVEKVVLTTPFSTLGEYSPMKQNLYRWAIKQIIYNLYQQAVEITFPAKYSHKFYLDVSKVRECQLANEVNDVLNCIKADLEFIVNDLQNENDLPFLINREGDQLTVWYVSGITSVQTKVFDGDTWCIEYPYVAIPSEASYALLIVFGFVDANDPEAIDFITKKAQLY